jgi:hypothetical protein
VFVCSKGKREYIQLLWLMLDPLGQLIPPSGELNPRLNCACAGQEKSLARLDAQAPLPALAGGLGFAPQTALLWPASTASTRMHHAHRCCCQPVPDALRCAAAAPPSPSLQTGSRG